MMGRSRFCWIPSERSESLQTLSFYTPVVDVIPNHTLSCHSEPDGNRVRNLLFPCISGPPYISKRASLVAGVLRDVPLAVELLSRACP